MDTSASVGADKIHFDTTANWNSKLNLVAKKGHIYCYSDWRVDDEGKYIVGIKIGDGKAYLIDMPFTDELWADHVEDVIIHITQQEREFWNNKVRCFLSPTQSEKLVFTTN